MKYGRRHGLRARERARSDNFIRSNGVSGFTILACLSSPCTTREGVSPPSPRVQLQDLTRARTRCAEQEARVFEHGGSLSNRAYVDEPTSSLLGTTDIRTFDEAVVSASIGGGLLKSEPTDRR
jgi:hypothetical protein